MLFLINNHSIILKLILKLLLQQQNIDDFDEFIYILTSSNNKTI